MQVTFYITTNLMTSFTYQVLQHVGHGPPVHQLH